MKTLVHAIIAALLMAATPTAYPDTRPRGQPENAWRYEFYNGRWWYWAPDDRWAFYNGRRWVTFSPPARAASSRRDGPTPVAPRGDAYPNLGNDSYSRALSAESRNIAGGFNKNLSPSNLPGTSPIPAGLQPPGGVPAVPPGLPARSGDAGSGLGGGSIGGTSVTGGAGRSDR